jgi:excisionase family DNA binding protein
LSTNFSEENQGGDWISQAEAARIHGVSRQAISKMIRAGRIRALEIGGHILVSRAEILGFERRTAGRPRSHDDAQVDRFLARFENLRAEMKLEVLHRLRQIYPIHPLEEKVGASAEIILEAIHRAGPLTLRGIRGVMAESAFRVNVVEKLGGWLSIPVPGDPPYDFLLDDGNGPTKVQVKLQRSKQGRPMMANEGYRALSPEMFVVETQRTRKGTNKDGEDTRPYRFGEFDILAVCVQPSTGSWDDFVYAPARWLISRPNFPTLLLKYQPVAARPNDDWSADLPTCLAWCRSGVTKTIRGLLESK